MTSPYLGLNGLFYDGTNAPPPAHVALGALRAAQIQPLSIGGDPLAPSQGGRFVFLSMGFSNTSGKFCKRGILDGVTCNSWSFMGRWRANSQTRKPADGLELFNGATKGGTTIQWDDPSDPEYGNVAVALANKGLSPLQVQVVWVEIVLPNTSVALPAPNADFYELMRKAGNQMRAMKVRYPNLRQAFVSPRDYAGFAKGDLSREPFSYEGGFAVKRLIQAQIAQLETGVIDSMVGDLSLDVAPWLTWGPYTWATSIPRGDGLAWVQSNYDPKDGLHFNQSGETKAANFMIGWFANSAFSSCWFRKAASCTPEENPPQYAQPVNLISNSGWTATAGSQLWDMIREGIADDAATAVATSSPPFASPGNTFTVGLSALTDPVSSLDHVIQVRARKPQAGKRIDGTVELLQDASVIATLSISDLASVNWTTYTYILSVAEADAITDYSALQLRITFWSSGTGTNRLGTVTQAFFKVPAR